MKPFSFSATIRRLELDAPVRERPDARFGHRAFPSPLQRRGWFDAVGQVMKYHGYPTSYSWNSMANTYATPTTAALLRDIRNAINWFNSSTSEPISACLYLNNVGYSHASIQTHNYSTICSNIDAGRPVIMSGANSSLEGHSWVCSGHLSYSTSYSYSLQVLSVVEPPLQYENAGVYYSGAVASDYLYMNWGWYGDYDGWYIADTVNPTPTDNYKYIRSEIINIYH